MADFADTAEEIEQQRIAEEAARRRALGLRALGLGSAPSRAAAVASGLPPAPPAAPEGPPLPAAIPGAAGSTQLGAAAPPPGFLAGTLGGAEVPGGVRGTPIPLGPSATLPGGMTSTPVSSPAAAPAPATPGGNPLDVLREQMGAIEKLTGAAPTPPYIQHMIESGSSTAGLAQLGGHMIGNQTPNHVTVDPTAALNAAIFHTQDAGRGADQRALFERLGVMGSQAIQHGRLGIEGANALTTRLREENTGSTIQRDANIRGADAYRAALAASAERHPEWSMEKHHQFASGATGMPTSRYQELIGVSPRSATVGAPPLPTAPGAATVAGAAPAVPGSVATAPASAGPPVNTNGISTAPPAGVTGRPWSQIERQLNEASGYTPARPASGNQPATPENLPANATVEDTLQHLENNNPGMTEKNPVAVIKYLRTRFGNDQVESVLGHQLGFEGLLELRPSTASRMAPLLVRARRAEQAAERSPTPPLPWQ